MGVWGEEAVAGAVGGGDDGGAVEDLRRGRVFWGVLGGEFMREAWGLEGWAWIWDAGYVIRVYELWVGRGE